MSPCNGIRPTAFRPDNATVLMLAPPVAIDCSPVNSDNGNDMFLITCQTPLRSRSQSVRTFLSESSRNSDATALVPFRTAAAPTSFELLALPLICSLTSKVHPPLFVEFCKLESDFKTTARRKFFWVRSNSGEPSPSTSSVLSQGC